MIRVTDNRPLVSEEAKDMGSLRVVFNLKDNGGRRLDIERRKFSYTGHIPERRLVEDRRGGIDRRCEERRSGSGARRSGEKRPVDPELRCGKDRRSGVDRRECLIL